MACIYKFCLYFAGKCMLLIDWVTFRLQQCSPSALSHASGPPAWAWHHPGRSTHRPYPIWECSTGCPTADSVLVPQTPQSAETCFRFELWYPNFILSCWVGCTFGQFKIRRWVYEMDGTRCHAECVRPCLPSYACWDTNQPESQSCHPQHAGSQHCVI